MEDTKSLVVTAPPVKIDNAPTVYDRRWVDALTSRMAVIHQACKELLKSDEEAGAEGEGDYGVIPGCGKRKVLKQSGAQKLLALFQLTSDTAETTINDLGDGHREYIVTCTVRDAKSMVVCVARGSCSTRESKYRYRAGVGEDTGTPVPGEYWTLRKKEPARAKELIGDLVPHKGDSGMWTLWTKVEKTENPDIADVYNTVLKMAAKRAMVAACIQVLGIGNLFTQDLDDWGKEQLEELAKTQPKEQQQAAAKPETKTEKPYSFRYSKSKVGELMGQESDQEKARFWKQARELCGARIRGEIIEAQAEVVGWDSALIQEQPVQQAVPFDDDLPWDLEPGEKKGPDGSIVIERQESTAETLARLKEKAKRGPGRPRKEASVNAQ